MSALIFLRINSDMCGFCRVLQLLQFYGVLAARVISVIHNSRGWGRMGVGGGVEGRAAAEGGVGGRVGSEGRGGGGLYPGFECLHRAGIDHLWRKTIMFHSAMIRGNKEFSPAGIPARPKSRLHCATVVLILQGAWGQVRTKLDLVTTYVDGVGSTQ